jgi:hypothetical protein
VSELLDAGAALRASPGDRGAIEAERGAVERVLGEAEAVLSSPAAAVVDRMRDTLHAAAGDEQVAERLRAGRLVEDHRAVGLGPWAGTSVTPAKAPRKKVRAPASARTTAAPKGAGAKRRGQAGKQASAAKHAPRADPVGRKKLKAAEREAGKAHRELAAAERDRKRAEVAFRSAERAHAEALERARKTAVRLEELRSRT